MLASVDFCQQPPAIALLLVIVGVISPSHGKGPKSRLIPLVASAFEVEAKTVFVNRDLPFTELIVY